MSRWELPPKGGHMELPTEIYYQTMTDRQAKERLEKNDLIIIPIGSTENHGPHACSGEDTFLVTRMAEQVARPPAVRSLNRSGMDPIPFIIWGCPVPSSFLKKILQPIFGRLSPDFGTPASESRFYSTVTGRIM